MTTLIDHGKDQPIDLGARVTVTGPAGRVVTWARDSSTDRWYPLGMTGSYNWWALRHLYPEAVVTIPERPVGRTIPARHSDPGTSKNATHNITVRANTQRAYLLAEFAYRNEVRPGEGLTDEEAAHRAPQVRMGSEYSKRCSELRDAGLIEPTGQTRRGMAGQERIVSRITDAGAAVASRLPN